MTPPARVFISHSAKEPQAQDVQTALVAALQDPARAGRFAILLDKVTLEPGDMWRSRINLWVGGCDAAVILLSKAALESAYVAYEASILSYRLAMNDSLLLIPVLLEDVTDEELKKGRLSPAQLMEVQAIRGQGRTPQEIAEEVATRLEKEACFGTTPLERRARHLADLLDFDRDDLVAAGSELNLDLDPWIPSADEKLRLRLAAQLLSVGMIGAARALVTLRGKILKKEDQAFWVDRVMKLVASSWVDSRSIDRLPRIAKGQETIVAVGVNACQELTAEMYVRCASAASGDPEDTWRWSGCNHIVAGDSIDQVIEKLSEKVEQTLVRLLDCEPGEVAEELEMMNAIFPQPVILFLPADGLSDEILTALRTRFPRVTFFLLMGKAAAAGPRLSEQTLELLFPELAPDDETSFVEKYKIFHATVRVR